MRGSTGVPWVPALIALGLLCCACGEPATSTHAPSGPWRSARLTGAQGVVAATVYGDLLLLATGDERRLLRVERSALSAGRDARAEPMPVEVARENTLEGHDPTGKADDLGSQGFRLGALWDRPLTAAGLAVRRLPARGAGGDFEALYLLDRGFGVVWWGRLLRGRDERVEAARLQAAFVVPGRPRAGREQLDWRDSGPGLCGLALAADPGGGDDLLVIEREGTERGLPELLRLDRFGQPQDRMRLDLREQGAPEVRALVAEGQGVVLLVGPGRGALVRAGASAPSGRNLATAPVPTPEIEGDRVWRALAQAADGTIYLVSDGSPAVVAWRQP